MDEKQKFNEINEQKEKRVYTKFELQDEIDIYIKEIFDIYESYKVYITFVKGYEAHKEEIIGIFPIYVPIVSSLKYRVLMGLSKILLNNEKKSFSRLLNICGKNSSLFPCEHKRQYFDKERNKLIDFGTVKIDITEDLKELRKEFKNFQVVINHLDTLRNKFFAHSDPDYFNRVQSLFSENPIKNSEIEGLIKYLCKAINIINFDLTFTTTYFEDDISIETIEELFSRLRVEK